MSDPSTTGARSLWWWRAAGVTAAVAVVVMLLTTGDAIDVGSSAAPTTPTSSPVTSTTAPPIVPSTATTLASTTTRPTTTAPTTVPSTVPLVTIDVDDEYRPIDVDEDDPAVANRVIPEEPPANLPPPATIAPPPWAASTRFTEGGHLSTDVGCAATRSLADLDWFFSARVGPVLGWDYQHVYPLGGDRYLWLFQDAFIDHSGTATTLNAARFAHNAALVQDGACFRLLHRGTTAKPQPFEIGDGRSQTRTTWWWPMGGELVGDTVWVFWAEMLKDPYDPDPPDGLGWHPVRTYLAGYDAVTLERRSFALAPNPGVAPIYGYAVSSDATHTYLFGNTFEQNLLREGGFWSSGHSATKMWLARVPLGQLTAAPEYRTADGWSPHPSDAVPIVDRFFVENPMQPRFVDGQWVSATDVDGYWGDDIAIDVAEHPWGPWHTVYYQPLAPRGNDPKMNTYHAHVLPWRDRYGSVLVSISNNARDMRADAWPHPGRYRPTFAYFPFVPTPAPPTTTTTTAPPPVTSTSTTTLPRPTTTTTTTTTLPPTTTTTTTTSTTTSTTSTTTVPATTSTSTTTTLAVGGQ